MVCSKILNFRELRVFDLRFFVTFCWYSCLSFMPTSSAILNVQLIFDSYFVWTCFGSSSIFVYSKNGPKNLHQHSRVELSIRNITYAICAKQFARNARIGGRTKIDFCTMITPLPTHRWLCANFWPKEHNNVAGDTVFPRYGPPVTFSCSRN